MIVLPLKCPLCDWRRDLPSDEPMANCPTCHVRLKPAGPVQCDEVPRRIDAANPFYAKT